MRILTLCAKSALTIAGVAALCIVGIPAKAAPGPSLPVAGSPTSIEVGIFAPSDNKDSKNLGGSTQFSGFFNYTLPIPLQSATPTTTEISLGVEAGNRSGNHYVVVPITATELFGLNGLSPNASGSIYAGAGIGAYVLNGSGSATAGRLGAQIQAGYNITSMIFIDARYQWVEQADGVTADVGLRF